MATYKTYKCPYCNSILSSNERSYWNDYEKDIGESIDYCSQCKKPYKTGKEKWHNMSRRKKNIIFLKLSISLILNPVYILIILYLFGALLSLFFPKISEIEKLINSKQVILLYSYLLVFTFSSFFTIKSFLKLINLSENNHASQKPRQSPPRL